MKSILSLSLDFARNNSDKNIEIDGEQIHIRYVGTDNDFSLMIEIAKRLSDQYDYIALDNIPSHFLESFSIDELSSVSKKAIYSDGTLFREIYFPWSLRHFSRDNDNILQKKRVLFLSAFLQGYMYETFKKFTNRISSFDPIILNDIDLVLDNVDAIDDYLYSSRYFELNDFFKRKGCETFRQKFTVEQQAAIKQSDIIVADESMLIHYDLSSFCGKTLLVDSIGDNQYDFLKSVDLSDLIVGLPHFHNLHKISNALMETFIYLTFKDKVSLDSDDIIQFIDEQKIRPNFNIYHRKKDVIADKLDHFAFIIHPLSRNDFFKRKEMKMLMPLKKFLLPVIERGTTYLDGFKYGSMHGIKSDLTGKEVTGDIYALYETPDMMMEAPASKIYKKLTQLCFQAEQNGAQIIGLGAYTKIVGDAGVTVNKMSPIPVTTGNSLSAASTLWAARICMDKMNIMKVDDHGQTTQPAMIVGATGSIGSVISKILCSIFKEVIIVAPRAYKLFDLKDEMEKISPNCNVIATTQIEKYIGQCPLVITTTSNRGKKLLDISKVMPGAVICDVSRPFDISKEESLTRPDVLVMANGEVELPGDVQFNCDLGLTGKVVYACLAETTLLALEGRFEAFTLSREISVQKVKDIYKMALKHGVRLAAIMGPTGEITDQEIALCREHALRALDEK